MNIIDRFFIHILGHECPKPLTRVFPMIPSPRPVVVRTVDTSRELAPFIQALYPGESLQGKLRFGSGTSKLCTFESMEAFIRSRNIGSKFYGFQTEEEANWHRCGHYGADFMGQYHHDKDWTGAAIGTTHFWPGEGANHVVGFMFGCHNDLDDKLRLKFWEVADETYRNPDTVIGGRAILHDFRAP